MLEEQKRAERHIYRQALDQGKRLDIPSRSAPAAYPLIYITPVFLALILGLWQIGSRSFTQDEAATLSAARRPLSPMISMLAHIDAVHGFYYILIHGVVSVAGASETVARFPSVVATAIGAGALTALGAHLAGRRAGFVTGLLYALSPPTTVYAQTARPYALATALVVVASYWAVLLGERGRRRDAVIYTMALSAAGWMNVLTLLVIPAHVVAILWSSQWRRHLRIFLWAVAAAGSAVLPILVLSLTQVSQVAWESPPSPAALLALSGLLAVSGTIAVVVARPGPGRSGPRQAAIIAAPWLMLPPTILAIVSEFSPLWEPRYVLFCMPALCLLGVCALTRLPTAEGLVMAGLLVVGMLAGQSFVRPAVASDDLRAVSHLLGRQSRPGDAVVFPDLGRRLIKDAYPAGFRHLRDVGLDTSAAHRNALYGLNVSPSVLQQRLSHVRRLWVVEYTTPTPDPYYGTPQDPHEFRALRAWQFPGSTVILYVR